MLRRKQNAFTLIELLVVIAIIGLLASIILISLNGARVKARDATRVADLSQIQAALELYYNANGTYPSAGCSSSGASVACWASLLAPTYMAVMPTDPSNAGGSYGLYYAGQYKQTGTCSYVFTGSSNDYILGTRLESPSSISGSCPGGYSGWDNSSLNYLIGS